MNLNFIEIIWTIGAIVLAVIAIKFTISFDLNEYQKRKDEKLKVKMKNNCNHATIEKIGDKFRIRSRFSSPCGTHNWYCDRCGFECFNINEEIEQRRITDLLNNPKKFYKQEAKFGKLLKKVGYL